MSFKTILFAGIAAATLSSGALVTSANAADDTYICNDRICYDDQADETRRLNLQAAENPGYDDDDRYDQGRYGYDDDADDYRGTYMQGRDDDDDAYDDNDDDPGVADDDDD